MQTLTATTQVSQYDLNGYYEQTLPLREMAHQLNIKEGTLKEKLHQPSAKVRGGYLVSLIKAPKIDSYNKSHDFPLYAIKNGKPMTKVHSRAELLALGVTQYNMGNIFLRGLNNPAKEESHYSWTNYDPSTNEFKQFCMENAKHSSRANKKYRSDIGKKLADGGKLYSLSAHKMPIAVLSYDNANDLSHRMRVPESRLKANLDGKLPAKVGGRYLLVPNGVSVADAMVKATTIKGL